MHTAICSFEDRAKAEEAADRLVQSGFDRREVHVEHRHADGTPAGEPGGGERRDHDVVAKFSFFERLFGAGRHARHAETYRGAVDKGLYVVVVEAGEPERAERAQQILHGLNPSDLDVVHRAGERPLHEVVAERDGATAERPVASRGWGEQPGLQVTDADKPIASPDLRPSRSGEKGR